MHPPPSQPSPTDQGDPISPGHAAPQGGAGLRPIVSRAHIPEDPMNAENDLSEDAGALGAGPDEVEGLLAALRALMAGVTIPVVRACLEEAHDDIAYLAGQADEE